MVCKVLESAATICFDGTLAHDGTTQFVRWESEPNVLTILEHDVIWSPQPRYEMVGTHLSGNFVVTIHLVKAIFILNQKI